MPASESRPPISRNQSLDVLRGVAILFVLGRHSPYLEGSRYLKIWFVVGWSGVDLFFVLSGFLISGLLFDEFKRTGTIDIKRFWIRRGFKIYPAFYVLIIFLASVSLFRTGHIPRILLGDVFFLQNYLPHLTDHGWSLAVEEHFYLVLPLLLALLVFLFPKSRDPFRIVPMVSIALTVLCLAMRISTAGRIMIWDRVAYPTHLRIDALFLGVTLGYYRHFVSLRTRYPWLVLSAGVLLLLPSFVFGTSMFTATVGLTLIPLGYACILIFAVAYPAPRQLRGLAWVGRYSYSIYLWHIVVGVLCQQLLGSTPLSCAIYLAASVLVGVGLSKLIEMPVLALRERWRVTRVPEPVPA